MMENNELRRGTLFVISGPSGAGKGTLRKMLFDRLPDLFYSVSYTTRSPRPGETDGVEYRFVSEEEFKRMIDEGVFLEWACVHGKYYGTSADDIERMLAQGRDVVLEIDVQGAKQVRQRIPEAVTIFVAPPSVEELEHRLQGRGTEEEREMSLRLKNAIDELSHAGEYQYRVVNDQVDYAAEDLIKIIERHRKFSGRC
ncbi:guanylate kinase [Thermanaerovibrio velox DSM 12556]|uniref:Guanylate kinase n=1 Tax=Thermanaerovibrio velox DSM 12556 TaxID=926567 RepID=H0US46_9BACT|nr:guanylate kinase [Thermanaerovibrio velox DSM 12556]